MQASGRQIYYEIFQNVFRLCKTHTNTHKHAHAHTHTHTRAPVRPRCIHCCYGCMCRNIIHRGKQTIEKKGCAHVCGVMVQDATAKGAASSHYLLPLHTTECTAHMLGKINWVQQRMGMWRKGNWRKRTMFQSNQALTVKCFNFALCQNS